MKKIVHLLTALMLLVSFMSYAQKNEPIQIGWQDLRGKVAPYDDPFIAFTDEQFYNFSVYSQIKEMQELEPTRVTEEMRAVAKDAKQKLVQENIDIEHFLQQRTIIMHKRKQSENKANELLADKNIKMSGYMLALEFDNGLVTEFLLVPTVGACSHKPVPPANQLVLVKAAQAVKAGNAYMPITVTGTLRITHQSQDLYLVDGSKNIEMAYTLEATNVAPYGR
ncbi:hypothetical protein GCM10007916_09580 [Psychromonas marina]|uniref:DUF3299 domain-containing protein n=1 Tax=Psychromonas marina TaxID=88364 RepID=A0ABQ6DXK4_9GAMM|nr:DUF3299 domain-containing protein [Psychromonas marina]GLS89891.1 hypothetical protein GCM10007916_09580 [Psychromonas marina]